MRHDPEVQRAVSSYQLGLPRMPVAGRSGEQIGRHRKACAEYGITPGLDAYRAGRAEGLREFCQPNNGYRAGVSNQVRTFCSSPTPCM